MTSPTLPPTPPPPGSRPRVGLRAAAAVAVAPAAGTAPRLSLAPFRVEPRLDPKPWGGRGLARFGFRLPADEPIGEAVITAAEAMVADGPFAGRSLAALVAADPLGAVGALGLAATGGRPLFPLLIKILDAVETLSLQVHPGDAAAPPGQLGKTEAWHVLAAAPGATIAVGLRPGITGDAFAAACRSGAGAGELVRWRDALPGETFLLPAGTVHALGGGCLVYEVQQPSDLTYRLDDWGRRDAAGRPRQLHLDQALGVLDAAARPDPIAPRPIRSATGRRQLLAACRFFALERIELAAGAGTAVVADGSPQVLTCLEGSVTLATANGATAFVGGQTTVIPAASPWGRLLAAAPSVILRAWVPDLGPAFASSTASAGHDAQVFAALARSLDEPESGPAR